MSLQEIITSGGGMLVLVLALVEVAPIRINPWTWLAKKAGRAINREVLAKVDVLDQELRGVKEEAAEQAAINCRVRILRFGDEIRTRERLHSKEHFDQILGDIKQYESYCEAHPKFENHITGMTVKHIKAIYMERLEKNDFL